MEYTINTLIEKIQSLGWGVSKFEKRYYTLSKTSPHGQDFSITVEGDTPQDLIGNIYETYEDFDVSEKTYLWLDNTGHGANGAPYEMKDVLADMEACEQMIFDLHKALIGDDEE